MTEVTTSVINVQITCITRHDSEPETFPSLSDQKEKKKELEEFFMAATDADDVKVLEIKDFVMEVDKNGNS